MSETATLPKPEVKPEYTMPEAFLGETVLHYRDKSSQPAVGIVVAIGVRSLGLNVISQSMKDMKPIDGCRHKSDPVWQTMRHDDGGWWDFTETGKMLRRLAPLAE